MDSCPEEDQLNFCKVIVSNPDISGIGVRVAIYAQTIMSMIIASILPYHEKAFRDTSRNCYVVSTSLMIASLIELKTHELSLFDALIVTMLTTIMTAFVTVNTAYIRTLGLSINISSFLFTTFWVYWGLQVWNDPKTFGIPEGEENCNASIDTVFVVFGHNVSVTNSGLRGFAMFIFAIGSISALAALWQCITWSLRYIVGTARTAKENAAARYARELRHRRARSGGKGQHMTRFGGTVGMIYMIVTTEQIVQRNPDVSKQVNGWTYSQTLALIMLGQQLMDCFTYFKEEINYRKAERARANGDVA
ncbi:hypothetical protein RhiTH_006183 [Rhizoctonia solani]|uniref:Transmembrane protein n=1 Tax=Rhizoctonia solani TaxID=456999 RepID=A0A8H7LHP2_9AGAM|nr:hypothetical protein RHS04_07399 [Rhizoctonia solani]